jgi:hypothetical protein
MPCPVRRNDCVAGFYRFPRRYNRAIVPKRWLILTAVVTEARAVARALKVPYQTDRSGEFASDAVAEPTSVVWVIGIGAGELPKYLSPDRVGGLLLAGFAGALDPGLAVGDVVVEGVAPQVAAAMGARSGKIQTVRQILATPAQKAAMRAESGAAAVEMEGDAVRQWASRLNVPFVQVRAISDAANDAIEPRVLRAVDGLGRVKPLALTGILLRHPLMLGALLRLGANARVAARQLGEAVARWSQSCGEH